MLSGGNAILLTVDCFLSAQRQIARSRGKNQVWLCEERRHLGETNFWAIASTMSAAVSCGGNPYCVSPVNLRIF